MSDFNTQHNRAVWFDIPVGDLARATRFYAAMLAVRVDLQDFGGLKFSVLEHQDGNGGCLVERPGEVTSDRGVLLYLNVSGRIRDAVARAGALGGRVIEPVTSLGPHGFRAIVVDSEGNRVALHSQSDA
ncbi:MAG: VOC family protein [Planctomycetota bacterium]